MSLRLTIHSPNGGSFAITMDEPEVRVGRASTCAVRLPYPVVSSHHLTISGSNGDWQLVDAGSTNGTVVDGRRLRPGEAIVISDGLRVTIVDVHIDFELVRDYVDGFTLAESGTLLRQMVGEVAANPGGDDLAFFEVLEGKEVGRRHLIPEDRQTMTVGGGSSNDCTVTGMPKQAFTVERSGDGFRVVPTAGVTLDGHAVTEASPLSSGMNIASGTATLVFIDPLEAYLSGLDDPPESPSTRVATTPPPAEMSEAPNSKDQPNEPDDPPSPGTKKKRRGLSALEWILLLVGGAVFVAALAALAIIFGLV